MPTLLEDIKISASWLVDIFATEKVLLDYSLESFRALDRFFDEEAVQGKVKPNGRLVQNTGAIMFSIAAYVGETIIKLKPGSAWKTDDADPQGEVNVAVVLNNGTQIFPAQRVIKRLQNGDEDGIYAYGAVILNDELWIKETVRENRDVKSLQKNKKPWWKIW